MSYQLGIDLGTTRTAVAVCRAGVEAAEPVPLQGGSRDVASTVFLGADGGLLVGAPAERRAHSDPGRVVRGFVRRIGDVAPVLVGREPVAAETLAALFVARLVREVAAREGAPPSRVAVTHPAEWGEHKLGALRAALAGQGVGPLLLLPEPEAAATGYGPVPPGGLVAVYDLGGSTFGASVVRATGGRYELVGRGETGTGFGGADIDDAVVAHVRSALGAALESLDPADPVVLEAAARLRRDCTAAKEALSSDTEVRIPVTLPGTHTAVRLARAELEDMIRPAVLETLDHLRRAVASAGVEPAGLAALLLVGGSARIPLVAELVPTGLGRPAAPGIDPTGVLAAGAALAARAADAQAVVMPVPTRTEVDGAAPVDDPEPVDGGEPGGASHDRPVKQARPFAAAEPMSRSRRSLAVALVAGAVVALLTGGAVAIGAARVGAGNAADAATPTPAATAPAAVPAPAPTVPRPAPATGRPPERRESTPPVATTRPRPTATSAPPATPSAAATTTTTPPPARGAGGDQAGRAEGAAADPAAPTSAAQPPPAPAGRTGQAAP